MSAETTTGGGSTEYIQHHLQFLQWQFGDSSFWTLNLDTVFFTVLLASLFVFFFIRTARKATVGVPGKFQTFVEMVVTIVDSLVRETFHGRSKFIAPLAITIFVPRVHDELHGHAADRPAAVAVGQRLRTRWP